MAPAMSARWQIGFGILDRPIETMNKGDAFITNDLDGDGPSAIS